jgi:tRNA(adenine34) deaminase
VENKHEQFMRQALLQAKRAFDEDEVPVGAVIVMNDQVIAKGYNQVQLLKDVTAHAEILALSSACENLQSKYLPEATLYVTLEPCLMCAGALYWNKIGHIVFGAFDEKIATVASQKKILFILPRPLLEASCKKNALL